MGFSAVLRPAGFDLFCLGKKFLVYNLVERNLKIKYRRSVFGFFWTLLNPMATAAVFYFVFKVILNVQIPHYLIFILSGMLPWAFFQMTISENMESLAGNFGLLTKVPIPLEVFPFAGTLTNFTTLLFAIPILLAIAFISGAPVGSSLLLLPFYLLVFFMTAYSLSLTLAIAYVYLRDLKHVMTILLQIWFYSTPVVYSDSMVPEKYRWIFIANPVATIFISLREILVAGTWPSAARTGIAVAWSILLLVIAVLVRKRYSREIVESL